MHAGLSGEAQPAYIIPPDTNVQTVVMADNIQRICSLAVSSDNDTVIRGVMLFAEQVRCRVSNSDISPILMSQQTNYYGSLISRLGQDRDLVDTCDWTCWLTEA